MQGCTDFLSKMKDSFMNGHGEYEMQPIAGSCVRSSDNEYNFDNLTTLYETSMSVYQCAVACNADETCVAFDYRSTDGYCYAYAEDPEAPYVGKGTDPDW